MDDATTSAPRTSAPAPGLGGDAPPSGSAPAVASSVANPRRTTL